jgi:hypothetical protein
MFNAFTKDDDPWGEQDFGAFDHEGERIFWGDRLNDETLKISLRGRRRSPRKQRVAWGHRRIFPKSYAKERSRQMKGQGLMVPTGLTIRAQRW